MQPIAIRPLDESSDLPSIARIYRDSIVRLGYEAYTPEQIAVWSNYPEDDPGAFQAWITGATTFVATDSQQNPEFKGVAFTRYAMDLSS